MAELKKYNFTSDGVARLQEELDKRKGQTRTEVAERIKVALSFGDLSENSEYDEAKEAQAVNEARIGELEDLLKNANVIDESSISNDKVSLGAKVTVFEHDTEDELEFTLVSSKEEDIFSGRISNESPLGAAIADKKVGDVVSVNAPSGILEYTIKKIG